MVLGGRASMHDSRACHRTGENEQTVATTITRAIGVFLPRMAVQLRSAVRLLLLACAPRPPSSGDEAAAQLDLWQRAATRPNNNDTPLITLPSYEKHLFNRTPIEARG